MSEASHVVPAIPGEYVTRTARGAVDMANLLGDDVTMEHNERKVAVHPQSTIDVVEGAWHQTLPSPVDPRPPFEQAVADIYVEAEMLLLKKHHDYGPRNISASPGGPLNGLRVRIHDKTARINNLIDSGAEPTNESLRDSFIDMLNYSAIALLVLDNKWPTE